jgi:hypothetical protein
VSLSAYSGKGKSSADISVVACSSMCIEELRGCHIMLDSCKIDHSDGLQPRLQMV